MGFGIRTAEDVAGLKDTIDGCIVGTHFIELMEENNYNLDVAKEYIRKFKKELNAQPVFQKTDEHKKGDTVICDFSRCEKVSDKQSILTKY